MQWKRWFHQCKICVQSNPAKFLAAKSPPSLTMNVPPNPAATLQIFNIQIPPMESYTPKKKGNDKKKVKIILLVRFSDEELGALFSSWDLLLLFSWLDSCWDFLLRRLWSASRLRQLLFPLSNSDSRWNLKMVIKFLQTHMEFIHVRTRNKLYVCS